MKNAAKFKQIVDERDITGAMMVYKPRNAAETAKAAKIIAERKAKNAAEKQQKSILDKIL
jgi:hypothetical protein